LISLGFSSFYSRTLNSQDFKSEKPPFFAVYKNRIPERSKKDAGFRLLGQSEPVVHNEIQIKQVPSSEIMATEYRVSLSYPNPSLGQMVAGSQTSNSIDDDVSRSKLGYGSPRQVKGLQQAVLVITYDFALDDAPVLTLIGYLLVF
jgi:hypothetical protein